MNKLENSPAVTKKTPVEIIGLTAFICQIVFSACAAAAAIFNTVMILISGQSVMSLMCSVQYPTASVICLGALAGVSFILMIKNRESQRSVKLNAAASIVGAVSISIYFTEIFALLLYAFIRMLQVF